MSVASLTAMTSSRHDVSYCVDLGVVRRVCAKS